MYVGHSPTKCLEGDFGQGKLERFKCAENDNIHPGVPDK